MNISYKLALLNDWEAVINEVISIDNKYKDNKFACDLIVSVLGELEKVSETKRKND